ncbi:YciI family protein [Hyphomonas atlantica]|uniref:YciI family protein n=1 Tax=Hyphomonas atlantica TaxID=1280948 RepID=UPI0032B10239|tara:strand:- start:3261 stop:3557 length:297 start_codon:yes stop_codon:yes gene_type:complete
MPLFAFHNLDNEINGAELRAANRPAHLAWVQTLGDAVRMAGPLMSEDGQMIGSLCLIKVESLAAAKALGAEDPYAKAGVFGHTHVHEVKWLVGEGKPA